MKKFVLALAFVLSSSSAFAVETGCPGGLCIDPIAPNPHQNFGCGDDGLCIDPTPDAFREQMNSVDKARIDKEVSSNILKDSLASYDSLSTSSGASKIDSQNAANLMNTDGIQDSNNF